MFDFNKNLIASGALVHISSNKQVFIYDEYPILFAGLNSYGLPVVGSYIAHDQEADDDVVYFIHLILSQNAFQSFMQRLVSYRELIEAAGTIYITEKNYDSKQENYYMIDVSDFPSEYLPLAESFLPEMHSKLGLGYDISLVGKLADQNKAVTPQASNVANSFADILALSLIQILSYRVIQKPSTSGSFKINLELQIRLKPGEQISLLKEESLIDMQVAFLDYCINDLHDEAHNIFFQENITDAPKYVLLKSKLIETYNVLGKKKALKEKRANEILLKNLKKASLKLEKAVIDMGPDFSSIKISNENNIYVNNPVGNIDNEVKNRIERTAIFVKSDGLEIIEDDEPVEYTINVYNLNTDTRVGNAVIFHGDSDHKEMSRPRIKIEGSSALEQSKYTQSLHSGKSVTVNAKGKRVRNRFLFLQIEEQ